MNDEVDMRRYGALRAFMPVTFVTFTAGYLALIGIPPFAGFYSKDPIIETAFGESIGYGAIALLGAGITAFYMTRVMLMTFFGTKRWAANAAEPHMSSAVADAPAGATAAEPHMSSAVADAPADAPDPHPHESPPVMTTPLWILGTLSLVGGFGLLYLGGGITHWLEPVTGEEHVELPVSVLTIQIITIAVVLAGAGLAWLVFGRAETPATQPAGSFVTVAARKDLYGDAVNETVLMRPGQYLTRSLVYAENKGLDAGVGSIAAAIGGLSARVRRVQTGFVRSYALSMLAGAAVVVIAMLVVRLS
jgi:NADH-quinone oxidoreductase subunit L